MNVGVSINTDSLSVPSLRIQVERSHMRIARVLVSLATLTDAMCLSAQSEKSLPANSLNADSTTKVLDWSSQIQSPRLFPVVV